MAATRLSTNYFRRTDENPLLWPYHYAQSFFLAPKMITIIKNFFSQNKAKSAGRSRKNAGMREIHQNAGFPASPAAYQTNCSNCSKSTKIGTHVD